MPPTPPALHAPRNFKPQKLSHCGLLSQKTKCFQWLSYTPVARQPSPLYFFFSVRSKCCGILKSAVTCVHQQPLFLSGVIRERLHLLPIHMSAVCLKLSVVVLLQQRLWHDFRSEGNSFWVTWTQNGITGIICWCKLHRTSVPCTLSMAHVIRNFMAKFRFFRVSRPHFIQVSVLFL